MADSEPHSTASPHEMRVTLGLLNAVYADSSVTQRTLSNELGIALGLANTYLKRCVRKGYIKISQIRPNRFAYYLTPTGFAEKSRLTASYLQQSFLLFREARIEYRQLLENCRARGWRRVVLFGDGDLPEIVKICAADFDVAIIGIVADLTERPDADVLLITSLDDPQGAYDRAIELLPAERVLHPDILNISVTRVATEGEKV
jgi:hypothetical protein